MTTKTKQQNKKVVVAAKNLPDIIHKPNPQLRGPSKTFQQDGHWIEKPNKTAILVCECGNRYLKTRPNQTRCLRCIAFGVTH